MLDEKRPNANRITGYFGTTGTTRSSSANAHDSLMLLSSDTRSLRNTSSPILWSWNSETRTLKAATSLITSYGLPSLNMDQLFDPSERSSAARDTLPRMKDLISSLRARS